MTMFRWFRRWQERILDKLAVKVADRIETLYEAHRPAIRIEQHVYYVDDWQNRHTTFKLKDIAHIKMRDPSKRSPHKKKKR
jgi:hypothetical protein